jgi:hypothetical protein
MVVILGLSVWKTDGQAGSRQMMPELIRADHAEPGLRHRSPIERLCAGKGTAAALMENEVQQDASVARPMDSIWSAARLISVKDCRTSLRYTFPHSRFS